MELFTYIMYIAVLKEKDSYMSHKLIFFHEQTVYERGRKRRKVYECG